MKKIYSLLTFSILLAVFTLSFSYFYKTETVSATVASGGTINGWAWSDNIGWISLNSANPTDTSSVPYGITVDSLGYWNGWAWSDNIGWIKFAKTLSGPNGTGSMGVKEGPADGSGVKTLTGWARACAGTVDGKCGVTTPRVDGWDGWINFSDTSANPKYSVKKNADGSFVDGSYAWGSDVVGWVTFLGSSAPAKVYSPTLVTKNSSGNLQSGFAVGDSVTLVWKLDTNQSSSSIKCSLTAPSGSTGFTSTFANQPITGSGIYNGKYSDNGNLTFTASTAGSYTYSYNCTDATDSSVNVTASAPFVVTSTPTCPTGTGYLTGVVPNNCGCTTGYRMSGTQPNIICTLDTVASTTCPINEVHSVPAIATSTCICKTGYSRQYAGGPCQYSGSIELPR